MSEHLTGTGGSITDESNSIYIGEWAITRQTGLSGFSGWKGRASLRKSSSIAGPAEGVFKMGVKKYHGSITIDPVSENPSRHPVTKRVIITFRGSGELFEG